MSCIQLNYTININTWCKRTILITLSKKSVITIIKCIPILNISMSFFFTLNKMEATL